jgi:hypothetical protein
LATRTIWATLRRALIRVIGPSRLACIRALRCLLLFLTFPPATAVFLQRTQTNLPYYINILWFNLFWLIAYYLHWFKLIRTNALLIQFLDFPNALNG